MRDLLKDGQVQQRQTIIFITEDIRRVTVETRDCLTARTKQ